MAVGLLIQTKQIIVDEINIFGFIGELLLNAELRHCLGILPMTIEAKNRGINNLIVPKDNLPEASLVKGINVFGFDNLKQVIEFITKISEYQGEEKLPKEDVLERNNN